MTIRPASRGDIASLTDLMFNYIVGFYRQEDQERSAIEKHIEYILEHPREGVQFVIEENAELLGFATLYYSYSTLRLQRIAILNDLFLSQQARGQGLGEALFKHCLEFARDQDVAFLQWETTKDNVVARSLYDKMGGDVSDLIVYEIRFSGRPPQ